MSNGQLAFSVLALDTSGNLLSQVAGSALISGKTTIPLALEGVWKTATARFSNANPVMGSPSVVTVNVSAYDAAGALIIGTDPYTAPIPLYNTDTTGAAVLSATSVSSPADKITLSYDGKSFVSPVVSAAVTPSQAFGQQDTLVPTADAMEFSVPSGSIAATNSGYNRLVVNSDGTMNFLEQGLRLGHVSAAGTITESTLPTYTYDLVRGSDDNLWALAQQCSSSCSSIGMERINADGSVTTLPALPNYSYGPVTIGGDGNFWMPSTDVSGKPVVMRVTLAGSVTTFPVAGALQITRGVLGADGAIWYAASGVGFVPEFVRVSQAGSTAEVPLADVPCCTALPGNPATGPDGQVYALAGTQLERITSAGVASHLSIPYLIGTGFEGQATSNPVGFGPDGALWIAIGSGCRALLERVTIAGSSAQLQLPGTCNNLAAPVDNVSSFAMGVDGNLWYTRGAFIGRIVLH